MPLAARQQAHDLGDENLSRRSGGAQARRFDHRCAEQVVVVARRFAGGDADAKVQRRAGRDACPTMRFRIKKEREKLVAAGPSTGLRTGLRACLPCCSAACCSATAHATASAALVKHSIRPSPVVLISLPWCVATAARQRGEVLLPQHLVGIMAELSRQPGRADQIAEDDRHCLGACHPVAIATPTVSETKVRQERRAAARCVQRREPDALSPAALFAVRHRVDAKGCDQRPVEIGSEQRTQAPEPASEQSPRERHRFGRANRRRCRQTR